MALTNNWPLKISGVNVDEMRGALEIDERDNRGRKIAEGVDNHNTGACLEVLRDQVSQEPRLACARCANHVEMSQPGRAIQRKSLALVLADNEIMRFMEHPELRGRTALLCLAIGG